MMKLGNGEREAIPKMLTQRGGRNRPINRPPRSSTSKSAKSERGTKPKPNEKGKKGIINCALCCCRVAGLDKQARRALHSPPPPLLLPPPPPPARSFLYACFFPSSRGLPQKSTTLSVWVYPILRRELKSELAYIRAVPWPLGISTADYHLWKYGVCALKGAWDQPNLALPSGLRLECHKSLTHSFCNLRHTNTHTKEESSI